ncbi:uncharacterized protein LOC100680418 isoform X3 [Nasonia vitripennis]|uniref:Uncharacterized protein n=1 Tax=Nasonia vitripennis TaxID=7425 RepID=A0A7M7IR54_NASVI|nr:uncharacterized protein LOC100680418 isoform X3 [Nasonia vitripennis]
MSYNKAVSHFGINGVNAKAVYNTNLNTRSELAKYFSSFKCTFDDGENVINSNENIVIQNDECALTSSQEDLMSLIDDFTAQYESLAYNRYTNAGTTPHPTSITDPFAHPVNNGEHLRHSYAFDSFSKDDFTSNQGNFRAQNYGKTLYYNEYINEVGVATSSHSDLTNCNVSNKANHLVRIQNNILKLKDRRAVQSNYAIDSFVFNKENLVGETQYNVGGQDVLSPTSYATVASSAIKRKRQGDDDHLTELTDIYCMMCGEIPWNLNHKSKLRSSSKKCLYCCPKIQKYARNR